MALTKDGHFCPVFVRVMMFRCKVIFVNPTSAQGCFYPMSAVIIRVWPTISATCVTRPFFFSVTSNCWEVGVFRSQFSDCRGEIVSDREVPMEYMNFVIKQ